MQCIRCKRKAAVIFANYSACESCFSDILEKRVRKEIRLNSLIEKDDRMLFINDSSPEFHLLDTILPSILKDLPIKITKRRSIFELGKAVAGTYDKIIAPWSCDDEAEYFLSCVLANVKSRYLGHYKFGKSRIIKPLLPLLHEEILAYARLKNIRFKEARKVSPARELLKALQKDHPEVMFSMLKSSEHFRK